MYFISPKNLSRAKIKNMRFFRSTLDNTLIAWLFWKVKLERMGLDRKVLSWTCIVLLPLLVQSTSDDIAIFYNIFIPEEQMADNSANIRGDHVGNNSAMMCFNGNGQQYRMEGLRMIVNVDGYLNMIKKNSDCIFYIFYSLYLVYNN